MYWNQSAFLTFVLSFISFKHDTARQRIEEKAVVISGNSVVLSGQSETKCVVYSWFTELNKSKDSGFIQQVELAQPAESEALVPASL